MQAAQLASTPAVEPWQNGKSELWQQNKYLLSSGEYSDCTFVVGSKPHTMVCNYKL
jgi:hypothetical protein